MASVKPKSSRKEDSEKESKRNHRERDKDDREHVRERNGVDRHHHRSSADKKSKDGSHHSLRDGSEDRHKRKEREGEREHKERSKSRVDDRARDRDDREADGDKEDRERHREKAKVKARDRDDREADGDKEDKERHREKAKVREKEQEREDKEHEKERERERERKEKEREHEDKERERDRERKEKAREKDREREDKERERERERMEKAREKEREREDKERERERERKERERDKERARRDREKEEERSREKEVDRIRDKEKRHATSRDYSSDDSDVKARDKKRRRHEDDYKIRDSEKGSKSNKHRDKNKDSDPQKAIEDETVGKKDTTREEDMAEEQKRLDEEMEKRRRRVQEWQELRRKKEDTEMETNGVASSAEDLKSGKAWTLEGESDDEESASGVGEDSNMDVDGIAVHTSVNVDAMLVDAETGPDLTMSQTEVDGTVGVEDIDPLDAFMNSMVLPEVEKLNNVSVPSPVDTMTTLKEKNGNVHEERTKKGPFKSMGRIISGEDSDSDYGDVDNEGDPLEDEDDEEFLKRVKKTKVEKLTIVDHSKIDYPPFRKNFHIEVKEIAKMTSEEVSAWRKQLELKIHGKDVPKPVKAWHQTGLSTKILDTIKKLNFERPMSIQAQALPVIMSGRDCIGIAKTGSGKTLAFVLPMLRHIKDQPALMPGDGPIGLVMAPTRELVQQIHSDIKKFAKVVGLNCVPVYGGSGVAQQISELKRGTEIVVCTPGRMIDILCTSSGKITNLRRVTYLVMDEADRMFDMGFEPQITRIVQNTRPDRQTVLFSATFPRQVETLARKVLNKPIEIQVGGRSVVNKDIAQLVEVRPENERFLRLLELLGEWYEKGKILIFVHTQEKCDALFKEMLRHGYPCLSLHGAKDQTDRESTITDFKSNVCNLMIATSIAARGLDVKELELVINFDVPNHYEDYVHRVGRTGRAGRKGCAITFIAEEDARYAPDLVKALELSEQVVPDDLKALADGFLAKVNQGLEKAHGTGYGGSGFKFNEEEDEERRAAKKAQAKEYGFEEDKSDSDDEDDGVKKTNDITQPMSVPGGSVPAVQNTNLLTNNGLPPGQVDALRAAAIAAMTNLKNNLLKIQAETMPEHYEAELEINEFPQNARWKVTHKETLGPISEWSGAAITTRGQYFPPGKTPGPGERKLYLFIEGPDEKSVKNARTELKRVLEDITAQTSSLPGSAQPGRYSVFS